MDNRLINFIIENSGFLIFMAAVINGMLIVFFIILCQDVSKIKHYLAKMAERQ